MYASEILIELKGGCSGSDFTKTEKGRIEHNNKRSTYVLSSWQEFVDFKGKYFQSSFFDNFKAPYFIHHRLIVVDVSYTGNRFIKNEKIYQTDRECGFSYELWDRSLDGVTACSWESLYVIQLKK